MTGDKLKRLSAPKVWRIPRKVAKWAIKPSPGPHPADRCIPLLYIIRDYLGYADTAKEARKIISAGKVLIDGRAVRDYRFPVGFMDVVSLPDLGEHYRVLMSPKGYMALVKISEEHAKWKLVRVENKTTVKGGRTQLNLHDGRNILVEEDNYKTGDVLKIEVPSQKILAVYKFDPGNISMIIGGTHFGRMGFIQKIEVTRNPSPNVVYLKDAHTGEEFVSIKPYVFVVGEKEPEVTISEDMIP